MYSTQTNDHKTIGKIYVTMISQLILTFGVMELLRAKESQVPQILQNYMLGYAIIGFALLLTILLSSLSNTVKMILYCLFAVVQGIILYQGTKLVQNSVIQSTLLSTICIFIALSVFTVVFKPDMSGMGQYLFAGLLGLIVSSVIVYIFFPNSSNTSKALSIFSLILFSLYVVYDTDRILNRARDSVIVASLSLYLDFINIFMDLLSLR
jgi:FtsH-binding integral membrane protein